MRLELMAIQQKREEVKSILRGQKALLLRTLVDHYLARRTRLAKLYATAPKGGDSPASDIKESAALKVITGAAPADTGLGGGDGMGSKAKGLGLGTSGMDDTKGVGLLYIRKLKEVNFSYEILPSHLLARRVTNIHSTKKNASVQRLNQRLNSVCEKSLGVFSKYSAVRVKALIILDKKAFDSFIIGCIAANSVLYMIQDHSKLVSWQQDILRLMEPVFLVVFTFECILKVIGLGFAMEPNSYLRDPWNWLDFTVVVTGLIEFLAKIMNPDQESGGGLSVLRMFRTLR